MFKEEIISKKRTGIGIFSRTGTRGYVGKMRTPFDLMSNKEKAKYKRSKVLKYNMYDTTIIPLSEFQKLPTVKQKEVLVNWRTELSSSAVQKAWSMGTTQFYKIVRDLGIEPDRKANFKGKPSQPQERKISVAERPKERGPYKKTQQKGEVTVMQQPQQIQPPSSQQIQKTSNFREIPVYEIPVQGMFLTLEGSYTPKELSDKVLKLIGLVDGESNKFRISLKVQEIMDSAAPKTKEDISE